MASSTQPRAPQGLNSLNKVLALTNTHTHTHTEVLTANKVFKSYYTQLSYYSYMHIFVYIMYSICTCIAIHVQVSLYKHST